jgi:signal transduction histidine kinase
VVESTSGGDAKKRRAAAKRPGRIGTTVPQHWLRILQSVTDAAVSHIELPSLLDDLLDRARSAMRADNAAILLLDADAAYLSLVAVRGPEEPAKGAVRIPLGRGVAGAIAASHTPRIVNDLSRVEVVNPLLRETARALVGVPLLLNERAIGVLHVDSAYHRRFRQRDVQLLEMLASPVALAIEHVRLYEAERKARQQVEATNQRLRALQAVSDVALEHASLDPLLGSLLTRIQDMLRVDNVAILLATPDGQGLSLYRVQGPEDALLGRVRIEIGEGVAGTIAATRQPLVIENLRTARVANPFLPQHFRSLLGVPLLAGERLVGVLHVDTTEQRAFSQADTELLGAVAERVSIAVLRAQQFESAQVSRSCAESYASALEEETGQMDEFLAIASHELRTPLTSLSADQQVAERWLDIGRQRRAGESEAEYAVRTVVTLRSLLGRTGRSIARLNRLIADLLDTSRAREGLMALSLEPFDLIPLLRLAAEEQRRATPDRTVRLKIASRAPLIVEADAGRVGQVVANFLSNACKYSPPGSPLTITLDLRGESARVSVRDEGLGVPEGERSHIWERFYRIPGADVQSGSQVGLGLGLYISRDIITRHGGMTGVDPALNGGASFWFTIPLTRRSTP